MVRSDVKEYLRIDADYTAEDGLIDSLIAASDVYCKNAFGLDVDLGNKLINLLRLVLISDWYENREYVGKATDRTRITIQSIKTQLQYAYDPVEETEGDTE